MRRKRATNTTLRRGMIMAAFSMASIALIAMLFGMIGTSKLPYSPLDIQKFTSTLSLVCYCVLLVITLVGAPLFSLLMQKSVDSLIGSITGRPKKAVDTTGQALQFWQKLFARIELIDSVLLGFLTTFTFLPYVTPVIMVFFEKKLNRDALFLLKGILYSGAAISIISAYYTVIHGARSKLLSISTQQEDLISELIRRQEIPLTRKIQFSEIDIEDESADVSKVLLCPKYTTKNIASVVPFKSFLIFVVANLAISSLFFYLRHYSLA